MLSYNRQDPPTVLKVVTTGRCNLSCSFCHGDFYMADPDTSKEKHLDNLIKTIKENPQLEQVVWTGGEPMLATRRMAEFFDIVEELRPGIRHLLNTNGMKMKKAYLPLLKRFHQINVSIDGYRDSERPWMNWVTSKSQEAMECLYELDNINTWAVISRERLGNARWYEDMLELYENIYHYGFKNISILFDERMPKPLTPDHMLNFIYGYKRMGELMERLNCANDTYVRLNVEKTFNDIVCNKCSEAIIVEASGDVQQMVNTAVVTSEAGCNRLANIIGVEAYKYLLTYLHAGEGRA